MPCRSHIIARRLLPALLATTIWAGEASAQILVPTVIDALADLDTRVTLANGRIALVEGRVTAAASATTALEATVRSLSETAASQTTAVTALTGQVAANATAVGALDARVVAQGAAISGLVDVNATTVARLEQQGTMLGTVQEQVAAVVAAGVQTAGRVDQVTADVSAVGDAVASVNGRLTGAEGTIATTVRAVADLDLRTAANATAIAAVDVRVGDNSAAIARERVRNDAQDVVLADHAGRIDRVGAVADASLAATQVLRGDVAAGRVGIVQVGASDAITVGAGLGGSSVSVAGTAGARRISGVAAGVQADDVATVGQLTGAMATTLASANLYTDQQVLRALDRQMGTTQAMIAENSAVLRRDMNGVAAHGAALSGLPQATVPGRGFAGVSMGGKGGEVALALGISKAFLGDHAPVLKAGAAVDTRRGDMTYNAGVGIHF